VLGLQAELLLVLALVELVLALPNIGKGAGLLPPFVVPTYYAHLIATYCRYYNWER